MKENLLPIHARAVVNFRILQGDSISGVIDHVQRTINNPRVNITPLANSLTSEPSKVSSIDSPCFRIIQRTILQVFPDILVAPYLVVGVTDSRHYAKLSENIYRFVPMLGSRRDTDRLHGTNERISIENYTKIVRFYIRLIQNSD